MKRSGDMYRKSRPKEQENQRDRRLWSIEVRDNGI
jgi:hypothetical protein